MTTPTHADLCGLCKAEPAGAKSHIYPKQLVRRLVDQEFDDLRMFTADPNERTESRRTGPWDRGMLGAACERRFQRYDDYAIKCLAVGPQPKLRRGTIQTLPNTDGGVLKLFFMHVLWRAHAATLSEFSGFSIGPRSEALRHLLIADKPGGRDEFPVLLLCFEPEANQMHRHIRGPEFLKWENGARAVKMQIAQWLFVITTSSHGLPHDLKNLALRPGEPVFFWCPVERYSETRFARDILDMVRERERKAAP